MEYDLSIALEIIQLKKKNEITKKQSFDELKAKLNAIEEERLQIIKGNNEIIKKVIDEYKNRGC